MRITSSRNVELIPSLPRLLLRESSNRSEWLAMSSSARDVAILRACYGGNGLIAESSASPLLIVEADTITGSLVGMVSSTLDWMGAKAKDALKGVVQAGIKAAPGFIKAIKEKFGDVTSMLTKAWGWVLANIPYAEEIVDLLKTGAEKLAETLAELLKPITDKIKEFTEKILSNIVSLFTEQIQDVELDDKSTKQIAVAVANESYRRNKLLLREKHNRMSLKAILLETNLTEDDDDDGKGAAIGVQTTVMKMLNDIRKKGSSAITAKPRDWLASSLSIVMDLYQIFLSPPKDITNTSLVSRMKQVGKRIQDKLSEYFSLFKSAIGGLLMKVSQILAAESGAAEYILKSAADMLKVIPQARKELGNKVASTTRSIVMWHGEREVRADVTSPAGFKNILVGMVKGSFLEDLVRITAALSSGVGAAAAGGPIKNVVTRIFKVIITALKKYITKNREKLATAIGLTDIGMDLGDWDAEGWVAKALLAQAGIKVEDD
jgi:hypothetical protein